MKQTPSLTPKCQGEMRIISFIGQPEVIKKILDHLGLWEESHSPPDTDPPQREITVDPSLASSFKDVAALPQGENTRVCQQTGPGRPVYPFGSHLGLSKAG